MLKDVSNVADITILQRIVRGMKHERERDMLAINRTTAENSINNSVINESTRNEISILILQRGSAKYFAVSNLARDLECARAHIRIYSSRAAPRYHSSAASRASRRCRESLRVCVVTLFPSKRE